MGDEKTLRAEEWALFRDLFLMVANFVDGQYEEQDRDHLSDAYRRLMASAIGEAVYSEACDDEIDRYVGPGNL